MGSLHSSASPFLPPELGLHRITHHGKRWTLGPLVRLTQQVLNPEVPHFHPTLCLITALLWEGGSWPVILFKSRVTGMAGAYQGPVPRAFSTRTFQGVGLVGSRWRDEAKERVSQTRLLSYEIARCCSDYPPSGYYHTLEKQRLGRAVSCVLFLQSLDLGWWQGLVEGLRPFSPDLARLLAHQPRGLGQIPWCRFVSSSFREGRWPVLTRSCTYVHTHTHTPLTWVACGVAGFTVWAPALPHFSFLQSDCVSCLFALSPRRRRKHMKEPDPWGPSFWLTATSLPLVSAAWASGSWPSGTRYAPSQPCHPFPSLELSLFWAGLWVGQ